MIRPLTHGGRIPTAVDLMDTGGVRLDPDLDDGMKELSKRHLSAAPVVDSTGWLRGLLTEKDCLRILSNAAFDGPSAGTAAERRKAEETPSAGSNRPLSIEQMQRVLAGYQRGR